jgi:galactokinase
VTLAERVRADFENRFHGLPALVVRAPGRVNLIGEHTDYNDGFVMPMAIDRAVWIALWPRPDGRVVVHSLDFNETAEFDLANFRKSKPEWVEYVKATAWALQDAGHKLRGWEGVIAGDVPIGAGLSSSAAMEMASARAFAAISDLAWDPLAMAKLGQRAENQWIGVNCGIMDEAISARGKAGHALLIDCRSLETRQVPLPPHCAVVVLDTTTRRGLVDSAYNERRAQCETAARVFGARALRDVSLALLKTRKGELDELTWWRARHVISENERTLEAAERMRQGDAVGLGKLMDASHQSLRDDFQVSNEALDQIVECARVQASCYGARMTGAGFGGCAVALVQAGAAPAFGRAVADGYRNVSGQIPNIYVCEATNGAELTGIGDNK